jgi:DNA-directed RNA polymerase specialized sigma54-like protein
MKRVQFLEKGQRDFMNEVLLKLNCLTLKELADRCDLNYSTMKNYYSLKRLLPENIFLDLCFVSKINTEILHFNLIEGNLGQVSGGKKSRKRFK